MSLKSIKKCSVCYENNTLFYQQFVSLPLDGKVITHIRLVCTNCISSDWYGLVDGKRVKIPLSEIHNVRLFS